MEMNLSVWEEDSDSLCDKLICYLPYDTFEALQNGEVDINEVYISEEFKNELTGWQSKMLYKLRDMTIQNYLWDDDLEDEVFSNANDRLIMENKNEHNNLCIIIAKRPIQVKMSKIIHNLK
jgi:hypothetical protein